MHKENMLQGPKILLVFVLVLLSMPGFSQVFGGNSPNIKWKQVNSRQARVIYPAGRDSVAQNISSIIYRLNTFGDTAFGRKRKINIVLQDQTTISNAYVALAPFKSEFFLNPLQNSFELGSLPWPYQLTIHEYRHVQQYNSFDVGLSHTFRMLFGEEGQALANNAAIPNWFFEGDAVYNETKESPQGRGRLPFFYNGFRSLWQSEKSYSWMKLRNGSFRDYVPGHYELGYMLIAFGREKYGNNFWKNVSLDAASYKKLFYPFQGAVQKQSGKSFTTFRQEAITFFKNQFHDDEKYPDKGKTFTDEEYPVYTDHSIIFVKSGYKQRPLFVQRTNGIEKSIRSRDISLDNYFSYNDGKIVYTSYTPDPRWGYKDFSDVQILDVMTGKQKTLTKRSKYFSPDISANGSKIIAVHQGADGKALLHLLDSKTGEVVRVVPNPANVFYTYPKFIDSASIVSAIRNSVGEMCLSQIDLASGEMRHLTGFSFNVLGFLSVVKDTIYFSGSYEKNDELFAYVLSNEKLFRIMDEAGSGIGKYQAAANDYFITWSSFTPSGYKITEVPRSAIKFRFMPQDSLAKDLLDFGINSLARQKSNPSESTIQNSEAAAYSKTFQLFNFHSIEPSIQDPEYSLQLISNNILNTFQSQAGITYDRAEKSKGINFGASYGGWFPIMSAGIDYAIDRKKTINPQSYAKFNELEPFIGISVPLNLTKGLTYKFFQFGSQFIFSNTSYTGLWKDSLSTINYSYLNNFISLTNQVQKARQQIFPAFAQSFSLTFKTALSHYKARQFVTVGNLYFPGVSKTHSLVLNGAFLKRDSLEQINFSSGFPFSKGYTAANFYKMMKWGATYHFPLCYPDAGFANIIYLLRVRAAIFYDDTHILFPSANGTSKMQLNSAGMEVYFDTKWWNQANIAAGFRFTHLFHQDLFGNTGRNRFEIILPVNIFNQ